FEDCYSARVLSGAEARCRIHKVDGFPLEFMLSLSKYFQLTDNQYRFRQAQPDKSSYEDFLDTLF
ncbi:MAG TPA: hypothetical protein VJ880_03420, partial [Allomuricauda sp.]|nr:hypothetical protein [Allomuricauda sp.]